MIVKAAIISDVGNGMIGLDEQTRGGGKPGLHNELIGCDAEDALNEARETDGWQAGALGE